MKQTHDKTEIMKTEAGAGYFGKQCRLLGITEAAASYLQPCN